MAGMRGVNQRQMQQAMRQMGIKQSTLKDVSEVVIRMGDKEIVITSPSVECIEMKGSKSYQNSGIETVREAGAAGEPVAPAEPTFPAEDVELVMSQTGCTAEVAVQALKDSAGQPAEAILNIIAKG